jgi:hypothetical protein
MDEAVFDRWLLPPYRPVGEYFVLSDLSAGVLLTVPWKRPSL